MRIRAIQGRLIVVLGIRRRRPKHERMIFIEKFLIDSPDIILVEGEEAVLHPFFDRREALFDRGR